MFLRSVEFDGMRRIFRAPGAFGLSLTGRDILAEYAFFDHM